MQLPPCPVCGQPVHPHTLSCPCGTELVFLPDEGRFSSDAPQCANRAQIGCNWQAETEAGLCRSCAMTQTVPDLAIEESTALWSETERAKRLAIQGFVRLGWFTPEDTGPRPVFHLLAERTAAEGRVKVLMAHADGEVTLNVAEADPAIRAIRQKDMDEDFRSMVGHVRHEMGHFVFWRLSQNPDFVSAFRALFGDERADYAEALAAHHESPQQAGTDYISSYATSHPHEDWAETFAHLMHLMDLADSFDAAGLSLGGYPAPASAYGEADADKLLMRAGDVAIALNHLNLSMGLPSPYPFVLGPGVRGKLAFVHRWMTGRAVV
ncbi:MAG: hypothetical protein A2092_00745 [Rhodobacteraceae bacterium GWE1_64_9]|nr:MAG: hypothetical protein A2092_00745 [Rhodobacteraceae bacterium GWE1_64_9]OHC50433.1 MAG: hypothetical protein A2X69_19600 [Rhodobacteraceae bacterium GWF1_65_7]HBD91742.1 hypothetical protein [Gemmobacter sp.]HBU16397.1 hypothetical protein [Gemmobacter sp.]